MRSKRSQARQKNYAKTQHARAEYTRWSESDEYKVLFSELTDSELSARIGRSAQAIQLKRLRLTK
jgi:hypothetical protein